MHKSDRKKDKKKEISKVEIFNVPYSFKEYTKSISISTKNKIEYDNNNSLKNNHNNSFSKKHLINKAFNLHQRGKIKEAANLYKNLINQGVKDHRIFSNYGSILKNAGNLNEAEVLLRNAIELEPKLADIHYNLGIILKDLGKLEEAELSTLKAINLKPNFTIAISNLVIILKNLSKFKKAELFARKLVILRQDNAEYHNILGIILRNLGKYQEAELVTRKAIRLEPKCSQAFVNLGIILRDLSRLNEAEIAFRKAITIDPEYAVAYTNLGVTLIESGNTAQAIKSWIKAIELNPRDVIPIKELVLQLFNQNKYEVALKYLRLNNSETCKCLHLGCLLSLDREKEFNNKFNELRNKMICNAYIGGIVEHAKIIYNEQYDSPFCNDPKKYILWDKIYENNLSKNSLKQLINYVLDKKTMMVSQGILHSGFQTSGNLFLLDYPFIKEIKKALETKIDIYKNKFLDSGEGFIDNWPKNYELRSWMISMKKGGFLSPHNHEYGWITGSFYLQVPKREKDDEAGSLAFSYQGPRYPNKQKKFDITIKKVENRDICIFPSSLFHHTIPFKSEEERICFVFDLIQK